MKEKKVLKRNRKKTTLYFILAISFAILCGLSVFFLLQQMQYSPLTLSIQDGETIAMEFGVDTTLPEVTASYRKSKFATSDTYVEVTMEGEVDLNNIGAYPVTYIASNSKETVTATRTYVVQDHTAPVISLLGNQVEYYSPGYYYTDPGFTASDNFDGDITEWVIRFDEGDKITYTVQDSYGNEHTIVRTLICQDVVKPTLTLNGEKDIIVQKGAKYTDAGCLAFDDVDGDITANIITTGTINTRLYGRQYITYTVVDSSGNISQLQRSVVVQEFVPPTLQLNKTNAYVRAGEEFIDPGYTATDNIDGDVTANVIVSGILDINVPGVYTLTYTAIDSSLNQTSKERTVYVYEPQPEDHRVRPTDKVVYLTFDDGPGPYTELLLDTLDKYNVDVTFFVTNQFADYQDSIGDAYFRGHTIALHTYSHNFSKVYSSDIAYYEDLLRMRDVVESQTGIRPTIIRFPGGSSNKISSFNPGIMTRLTKKVTSMGYHYFDWNVDSDDAGKASSADEVFQNVISGIGNKTTAIVLQHDIKGFSVDAVERIVQWGLANGYVFCALNENSPTSHHPVNN